MLTTDARTATCPADEGNDRGPGSGRCYPAAGLTMLTIRVLWAAVASTANSYLIWRNAPDRQVGLQAIDRCTISLGKLLCSLRFLQACLP